MWVSFCSLSCHLSASSGSQSGASVTGNMQKQFRKLYCSEVALSQERRKRRAHSCVLAHTDKTATDESERNLERWPWEVTEDSFLPTNMNICNHAVAWCQSLFYVLSHQNIWIFNSWFRVLLAAALYLSSSYRFWIVQIQKQGIEESWHLGWHCFPWTFSCILKIADWSSAGRSLSNVAKLMTEGRQKISGKMKLLHCPAWKVKNCHFKIACAKGGSPTLGVSPSERATVNIAICDVPGEGLCWCKGYYSFINIWLLRSSLHSGICVWLSLVSKQRCFFLTQC